VTGVQELTLGQPVLLEDHSLPEEGDDGEATARRNRAATQAGRVRLIHTPVESLSVSDGPFNAALAVNTVGMWPDLTARLHELARLLRPGGRGPQAVHRSHIRWSIGHRNDRSTKGGE